MANADAVRTLVTRIKLRDGAWDGFRAWHVSFNSAIVAFPGLIAAEALPPTPPDQPAWIMVQRFTGPDHLQAWRDSPQRRGLLAQAAALAADGDPLALCDEEVGIAAEAGRVTEVISTRVRAGAEDQYRRWLGEIQQAQMAFPGYYGVNIQPPRAGTGNAWTTLVYFDSPEHLDTWLMSDQRRALMTTASSLIEFQQQSRVQSPFAGWFPLDSKGRPALVWKQTMLVLLVLFPIVAIELRFLSPLLTGMNPAIATFIGNLISVSLISWPMMPLALLLLDWWVMSPRADSARVSVGGALLVVALYAIEIGLAARLL